MVKRILMVLVVLGLLVGAVATVSAADERPWVRIAADERPW
jgi:hypothetical protein